jgi:hypothetical protein
MFTGAAQHGLRWNARSDQYRHRQDEQFADRRAVIVESEQSVKNDCQPGDCPTQAQMLHPPQHRGGDDRAGQEQDARAQRAHYGRVIQHGFAAPVAGSCSMSVILGIMFDLPGLLQ